MVAEIEDKNTIIASFANVDTVAWRLANWGRRHLDIYPQNFKKSPSWVSGERRRLFLLEPDAGAAIFRFTAG